MCETIITFNLIIANRDVKMRPRPAAPPHLQEKKTAKYYVYVMFRGKHNLVPRVFSLSNMAAAGEKTLAHSRNHVTDLSTESGNLFKMAAKIKSERIWVLVLGTGEKQTKWRQR